MYASIYFFWSLALSSPSCHFDVFPPFVLLLLHGSGSFNHMFFFSLSSGISADYIFSSVRRTFCTANLLQPHNYHPISLRTFVHSAFPTIGCIRPRSFLLSRSFWSVSDGRKLLDFVDAPQSLSHNVTTPNARAEPHFGSRSLSLVSILVLPFFLTYSRTAISAVAIATDLIGGRLL